MDTEEQGARIVPRGSPCSPTRRLQLQMTSKLVLKWISQTWTAAELKLMLERARRREPALHALAHKNGRLTREPANIPEKQQHLLVNAVVAALYMVAKGGPNDGEAYYAPMLAHRVHEAPERMMELPPVAAATESIRSDQEPLRTKPFVQRCSAAQHAQKLGATCERRLPKNKRSTVVPS